jgi:hypothetical protein
MKTLQECKDEIASRHGHDEWDWKIYENGAEFMENVFNEVADIYAKQYKDAADYWENHHAHLEIDRLNAELAQSDDVIIDLQHRLDTVVNRFNKAKNIMFSEDLNV